MTLRSKADVLLDFVQIWKHRIPNLPQKPSQYILLLAYSATLPTTANSSNRFSSTKIQTKWNRTLSKLERWKVENTFPFTKVVGLNSLGYRVLVLISCAAQQIHKLWMQRVQMPRYTDILKDLECLWAKAMLTCRWKHTLLYLVDIWKLWPCSDPHTPSYAVCGLHFTVFEWIGYFHVTPEDANNWQNTWEEVKARGTAF